MKRALRIAVFSVSIWLLTGTAFAQHNWVHPGAGMGNQAQSGGARGGHAGIRAGGHMGGQRGGAATSGRAARPGAGFRSRPGPAPTGTITDQSFPGRLGRTVGGNGVPVGPAYGNINHPGIQPLPTTSGFPIPNINSPGGAPGLYGGLPGKGARHHRGSGSGYGYGYGYGYGGGYSGYGIGGVYGSSVLYAVPYYVPVYPEVVEEVPVEVQQPRPYDIREYQGPSPAPPEKAAPSQPGRTVTLLAFKDAMVIAVTDYWMQGDSLVYETSLGVRTVVPLNRLDWALTQQLNFERNVPFVLEARP